MEGELPGQGLRKGPGEGVGSVGFVLQGLETHRLRTTALTMGCIHTLLDGLYLGDPLPNSPEEGVITVGQGLLQGRARVG